MTSSDKSLEDKAIDLKGKKYVMVKDRLAYFNETYPKGAIKTEFVEMRETDGGMLFVVRAQVFPEGGSDNYDSRVFTGLSQATLGGKGANKEAALENAETSAVGRALAFMGIGVIDSIASKDEMTKAGVDDEIPF